MNQPPGRTDGHKYLNQLAAPHHGGFAKRFSRISQDRNLAWILSGNELSLLLEATFLATLCNISFNGLGGCGGEIKPEREAHRISLEQKFMTARERFCNSPGWNILSDSKKASVQRIFLSVFVTDDNLAG